MKIKFSGAIHQINSLELIASSRINADLNSWDYISQSLFKIDGDKYAIRTDRKLGPKYNGFKVGSKIMKRSYTIETNPGIWLLKNGHEKLATIMFPETKNQLKQDFHFDEMDERSFRGETLYDFGETNGEARRRVISV